MWEDCGFKTYYGNNQKYMEQDIDDNPFAPVRRRLQIREALESIKDQFYQMEEAASKYQEDDP